MQATDSTLQPTQYSLTGLDRGTIFRGLRLTPKVFVYGIFTISAVQGGAVVFRAVFLPSTFFGLINIGSILLTLVLLAFAIALFPTARRPTAMRLEVGANGWSVNYSNGTSRGQTWSDPKLSLGMARFSKPSGRSVTLLMSPVLVRQLNVPFVIVPDAAAEKVREWVKGAGVEHEEFPGQGRKFGWINDWGFGAHGPMTRRMAGSVQSG